MKVLRVLGSLAPRFGGPSVSALNSSMAAQRSGVDTTIAFPVANGRPSALKPVLARLEQQGVKARAFPLVGRFPRLAERWAVSLQLVRWVQGAAEDYDLIHCHSPWTLSALGATFSAGLVSTPVVMSPHECLTRFDLTRGAASASLKRFLRRVYAARLDGLVFASELELKDSLEGLDTGKCGFVYHPVWDGPHARESRRPALRHGRLRLGFLGRLHPKKNLDLLLCALRHLHSEVTLVVAGTGAAAYERNLRRLAERECVAGRVSFLGFISSEEKPAFFASIDVLAMPSKYECFGMSAAEAMAHGTPVVVSKDTGVAEVVRRYGCGVIVEATLQPVVGAIATLTRHPRSLLEMSRRAALAARRELSFEAHGVKLASFYRGVIGRRCSCG